MRWKFTNAYRDQRSGRVVDRFECSECGYIWHRNIGEQLYNFCPNCGADMRAEQTEPQTQLTAKCLECNNSKACKENHWEGCRYEPLGYEVTAVVGTMKDEPQTYITEDRDTRILDAWQVHHRNTTSGKDEPQTDGYISGEDFMKIFDEPQTDCPTSCPSKDICTKDIADCAWK